MWKDPEAVMLSKSKLQHNGQCDTVFFKERFMRMCRYVCISAQKRSWRKHINPWTVVSSGGCGVGLEEWGQRERVFVTSHLCNCVPRMWYNENVATSDESGERQTVETAKRSVAARV